MTSRETLDWRAHEDQGRQFLDSVQVPRRYWYGEPRIVEHTFTFTPDGTFVSAEKIKKHPASPARVYEVHKKVSDFPDREDMSTPEAAYALINRAYAAESNAAWPRLSVPWQADAMPAGVKRPLPKQAADRLNSAQRHSKSTSGTEACRGHRPRKTDPTATTWTCAGWTVWRGVG